MSEKEIYRKILTRINFNARRKQIYKGKSCITVPEPNPSIRGILKLPTVESPTNIVDIKMVNFRTFNNIVEYGSGFNPETVLSLDYILNIDYPINVMGRLYLVKFKGKRKYYLSEVVLY